MGVYDIHLKYGFNVSVVREAETFFKDVAATKDAFGPIGPKNYGRDWVTKQLCNRLAFDEADSLLSVVVSKPAILHDAKPASRR